MLRYVTFNIRYDCKRDGINNFEFRKPMILDTIAREQPDLIGFQEVLPHVARELRAALPDYMLIGCPRGPQLDGEQVSVALRCETMNLMEMRTFWLSPTPMIPGSRYPDQSNCPRTVTEAVAEHLPSGRVIRILNIHLDHAGPESRRLALRQLIAHAENCTFFPDAPLILSGDFNAEPDSPEMSELLARPDFVNVTKGQGITYHGFGKDIPAEIDYIFTRGNLRCAAVRKWTREEEGVFLSDHYPLSADFEMESDA